MQCPLCYSLVDENSRVCPNCGAILQGERGINWAFIIVPIVVLILIFASIVVINPFKKERKDEQQEETPIGILIDGNFDDWSNVSSISGTAQYGPFNPNVDIIDYRIDDRRLNLSFFLSTEGEMLAGEPGGENHVDTIIIFIDTDQNPQSGYFLDGIGADYMVEIFGWEGVISNSSLFSYSEEAQDWNLWESESSVAAAVSGSSLEAQVPFYEINLHEYGTVDVRFYTQSWDRYEDFSDTVISNEEGILIAEQQGIGEDVITGVSNRLLKLEFEAINADITVSRLEVIRLGYGIDDDVDAIILENENHFSMAMGILVNNMVTFWPDQKITEGQNAIFYLVVDVSGDADAENSIGFRIVSNHDISTDRGTVHLRTLIPNNYNDVSYISRVPVDIKIDGAFADWEGEQIEDDIINDVSSENLDIVYFGVSNTSNIVSFYLNVDGIIERGTPVPFWRDNTSMIPRTGEDRIYIYLDSDNTSSTGYSIGGIGADYMIRITGRYNKLIENRYYRHLGLSPSDWDWLDLGSVPTAMDSQSLEAQIFKSSVNITGHFKVYFQTENWNGSQVDYSYESISGGR